MSAIDDMLDEVRRTLHHVPPERLDQEVAAGALLIDIRPESYRINEGEMPEALVIERNVLEWRLDPTSPDAIPEAGSQRRMIIVCNEGYASSLAAYGLQQLGLADATDVEGGYRAWRRIHVIPETPRQKSMN